MSGTGKLPVTFADIDAAARRIAPFIHRTPVFASHRLNEILGVDAYFKCENFQRIGAFKARGAHNAVFALSPEQAAPGVATHSSGNHAAALSLAARNRGIPAYIVMPSNAPRIKMESVRRLGGTIRLCEPTMRAREAAVAELIAECGAILIHPYDNDEVIAGQGTAALELFGQVPELDMVMAPVGGGGLMSGTAVAARAARRKMRIVACEPVQADDAYRSWASGRLQPGSPPDTIADGLRTTLGERAFVILRELLDDFVTVREASIVAAMRLVWEVMKVVIEPSAAVPVAALLEAGDRFRGQRVGVILSGGNADLDRLPWLAESARA